MRRSADGCVAILQHNKASIQYHLMVTWPSAICYIWYRQDNGEASLLTVPVYVYFSAMLLHVYDTNGVLVSRIQISSDIKRSVDNWAVQTCTTARGRHFTIIILCIFPTLYRQSILLQDVLFSCHNDNGCMSFPWLQHLAMVAPFTKAFIIQLTSQPVTY